MSDELINPHISAGIWTLYRNSIPSPWREAVFLDQWPGDTPMPKYGQRWGTPCHIRKVGSLCGC